MKKSWRVSKQAVSVVLLPVFLMLCVFPLPTAQAASPVGADAVRSTVLSPLAYSADLSFTWANAFKLEKHAKKSSFKVVVNSQDTSQIYYVQESHGTDVLIMRYVYDEMGTVTLLLATQEDPITRAPIYSRYYRYALGPDHSLMLILEEGWVAGSDTLIPSQFYDYSPAGIQVRFFDKLGNLLRIDSSDGARINFIYNRTGQLMTIKNTSPLGEIVFHDQLTAASKTLAPERPASENPEKFYTLTNSRVKDEKRSGLQAPFTNLGIKDPTQTPLEGHLAFLSVSERLLDWLARSNPTRAGPLLIPQGGRLP